MPDLRFLFIGLRCVIFQRMNPVPFDTLKFVNTLKISGVPENQAEAHANAMSEVWGTATRELATKDDIRDLKREFAALDGKMIGLEGRMTGLESKLNTMQWVLALLVVISSVPLVQQFFS